MNKLENGEWKYTEKNYFTPVLMGQLNNKVTCRYAKRYRQTWNRQLKKLSCFRHFDEYKEFI